VAFLGLLDPSLLNAPIDHPLPVAPSKRIGQAAALVRFVARRLTLYRDGMRVLGPKERALFMLQKAKLLAEALQQRDLFRGDRREFLQRKVADTNLRAMLRHRNSALAGAVPAPEIFASEPRYDRMTESTRAAWNELAGIAVTFHRVSGKDSGDAIQGAHARTLAALLARRLQRVHVQPAAASHAAVRLSSMQPAFATAD
jgi:hypothetical protein